MTALRSGRLDPLDRDRAVPLEAPLYQRLESGWCYRDVTFTSVTFETDEDPVLDLLPPLLTPLHSPPRVTIVILECRESAFGAYDEIKVEIAVEFGGEPYRYCPYIMVSAVEGGLAPDAALAMGREVMGVPKKVGHISMRRDAGQIVGTLERPIGVPIVTLAVATREAVGPDEIGLNASTPVAHLRLIPSVDGGPPSVSELIRWDTVKRIDERRVWRGPATVDYGARSTEDPWHRLVVREVIGGCVFAGELDIPPTASVLHDYRTQDSDQ
jgi:acetoacetate decarboxylase